MEDVLETMYRKLQQQTERISDEGARRQFLQNVP